MFYRLENRSEYLASVHALMEQMITFVIGCTNRVVVFFIDYSETGKIEVSFTISFLWYMDRNLYMILNEQA